MDVQVVHYSLADVRHSKCARSAFEITQSTRAVCSALICWTLVDNVRGCYSAEWRADFVVARGSNESSSPSSRTRADACRLSDALDRRGLRSRGHLNEDGQPPLQTADRVEPRTGRKPAAGTLVEIEAQVSRAALLDADRVFHGSSSDFVDCAVSTCGTDCEGVAERGRATPQDTLPWPYPPQPGARRPAPGVEMDLAGSVFELPTRYAESDPIPAESRESAR